MQVVPARDQSNMNMIHPFSNKTLIMIMNTAW